jgi:hypothetical protein
MPWHCHARHYRFRLALLGIQPALLGGSIFFSVFRFPFLLLSRKCAKVRTVLFLP